MEEHIENVIVALEVLGSAIIAAAGYWLVDRRRKRKEAEKRTRKDVMFPPAMLLLLAPALSGCGLFSSGESYGPALATGAAKAAELAKAKGVDPSKIPMTCQPPAYLYPEDELPPRIRLTCDIRLPR
jgi:hypothetical protein